MEGIEIHGDVTSRFLDVNLKDVLPCLKAAEAVQWHLLYLEAWGCTGIQEYDDPVQGVSFKEPADGASISREHLQQLADAPAQIVNLLLLGSADVANLHRYEDDQEMYAACEYVVEVVDSSYLLIHSHDQAFLTCLRNTLEGVRPVDSNEPR